MSNKIIDILSNIAPTIATALGGPLAGTAIKTLSNLILNKDNGSENDIYTALQQASPETLVRLKELDYNFKIQQQNSEIEKLKTQLSDVANARNREIMTADMTTKILAFGTFFSFILILLVLIFVAVPTQTKDILNIMIGALGAQVVQVGQYYFGSSTGSLDKSSQIKELLQTLTNKRNQNEED